jgi:transposase
MSLTAPDEIDFSDPQAVRALFDAHLRELTLRDRLLAEKEAKLAQKDVELAAKDALIAARDEKLSSRDQQIEHLKLLLEKMRRDAYGAKSEKLDRNVDQLEFKLEELESDQAADEVVEQLASDKPVKNKPARKPLPDHLQREVITHTPPEQCCPDCGGKLRKLGEDVSEYLERIPETFKVIRHVRVKMSCSGCDKIVQPSAPPRPIERCLAGPALLAHVLAAKYANHIPLNRQSEIYAREGVELDRSTLAGWVGACSQLLSPLVEAVRRHVMAGSKLHADDTPVPVLSPGRGRTKTGRLWTYVRDDRPAGVHTPPAVWFAYSPDRKGEHPRHHLKDFRGVLQADAYAGFGHLYGTGNVFEAACMAHARRKFHDIHEVHPSPITTEALDRIGALYGIEREIRGQTVEQRKEIRQARAKPLLDQLHRWLEQKLTTLSTKSDTAAAIRYALSRWRALTRYVDDGLIEIDNSSAERALRAVALGRRNYLFAGADSGGHRAAAIYSLVGSAKLNGIDPKLYLREVITRIAQHPINRIGELLPWNLKTNTVSA